MMSLDSKPKVVYMLGAGASAQALPTVAQIPQKLDEHYKWLMAFAGEAGARKELIPGKPETERHKILGEYCAIIDDLKKSSANHESIDTYAKKLYLRSRTYRTDLNKLDDLKLGLSLFMAYLQTKHRTADSRYDGFLASLLKPSSTIGPTLPDDVLILNWNYDQQLAIALTEYLDGRPLEGNIEGLGIVPVELLPVHSRRPCHAVHLNGMFAYRHEFDMVPPLLSWSTNKEEDLLESMLQFIANFRYSGTMIKERLLLRFAWEETDAVESGFQKLEEVLGSVKALVVIGYSFPFFNRDVDRRIMRAMESLEHVYVQAPPKSADEVARTVRSTMQLPEFCKVEIYGNTDKFLLPAEL